MRIARKTKRNERMYPRGFSGGQSTLNFCGSYPWPPHSLSRCRRPSGKSDVLYPTGNLRWGRVHTSRLHARTWQTCLALIQIEWFIVFTRSDWAAGITIQCHSCASLLAWKGHVWSCSHRTICRKWWFILLQRYAGMTFFESKANSILFSKMSYQHNVIINDWLYWYDIYWHDM